MQSVIWACERSTATITSQMRELLREPWQMVRCHQLEINNKNNNQEHKKNHCDSRVFKLSWAGEGFWRHSYVACRCVVALFNEYAWLWVCARVQACAHEDTHCWWPNSNNPLRNYYSHFHGSTLFIESPIFFLPGVHLIGKCDFVFAVTLTLRIFLRMKDV